MSLQIKASRISSQGGIPASMMVRGGDPGLFGFLGKAIGGAAKVAGKILPGPAGAIAGTIGGALAGRQKAAATGGRAVQVPAPILVAQQQRNGQQRPAPINLPGIGGPGVGFPSPFAQGGRVSIGEQQRMAAQNGGGPAPSGFHWNKSDYFLKDGTFVPKGTKLVKNRRRNPLNPRALDRAIGRISSAKRASKKLGRVTIRKKKC